MRDVQAARGASLSDPAEEQPGTSAGAERDAGDTTGRSPVLPRRRTALLFLVGALILAVDVISKTLVVRDLTGRPPVKVLGGFVYLVETRNTGAAFNFAEGQTVVLSIVALAVVAAIVRFAGRLRSVGWAICLGLILGGALGNLVDRIFRPPGPFRGAVIDWISLLSRDGSVWPIFNIADSSLVAGVLLAILLELLGRRIDGSGGRRGSARV